MFIHSVILETASDADKSISGSALHLTDALVAGESITIPDFGTFEVRALKQIGLKLKEA